MTVVDHEGIHLEAYLHQPFAFQGFRPEIIGNRRKVLLGIFAGKASVRVKLDEIGEYFSESRLAALAGRVSNAAAESPDGLVSDDDFRKMVKEVKEAIDA
jgi:isopropylmalate/homocitrate/citramalate synthase